MKTGHKTKSEKTSKNHLTFYDDLWYNASNCAYAYLAYIGVLSEQSSAAHA